MQSLWEATGEIWPALPALHGAVQVDTAIVGGGITGLCTAWRLVEAGQRVAVLEAGRFAALNTGNSTGNLYATVSGGLAEIRRKWDDDGLRDAVRWRAEAVDWIEGVIDTYGIDCDFARRTLHRGVAGNDAKHVESLQEEFDAADAAELSPRWIDGIETLPIAVHRAFRFDGQAQFNPYRFAQGMVRLLAERGALLHENSHVTDIDAGDGIVRTAHGEVRARHIVLATHSPVGFNLVQAEMEPYREYGIAARCAPDRMPEGIHWLGDLGLSVRGYRREGQHYVVLVGAKHRVGHSPEQPPVSSLQRHLREHFGIDAIEHAWSAQQFTSADGLPYIGRSAHDNVLIATGFAADGLTWGTVASAILTDLVEDRETDASRRLTPRRFTPVKSAKVWLDENRHVVEHLVKDRLRKADLDRLADVPMGEGRIIDIDGDKHAVYRDEHGHYQVVSPVCTHLGCHVHWNGQDRSWDCPCHGSRFRPDGSVIDGPAIRPLADRAPLED